jgi:hypothetical protein
MQSRHSSGGGPAPLLLNPTRLTPGFGRGFVVCGGSCLTPHPHCPAGYDPALEPTMSSFSVTHAPSFALAPSTTFDYTVEAEYGAKVVEGRIYTAAHHQKEGPFSEAAQPAPCNNQMIKPLDGGASVLVSHLDLDTIGGCLRAHHDFQDLFSEGTAPFWAAAEFVDLKGPHRIAQSGASPETIEQLRAFWAWSKTTPRLPFDRVADATAIVIEAGRVLREIFEDDAARLEAGRAWAANEAALNARTFVRVEGGVVVRIASGRSDFCNQLYCSPDSDHPERAVVSMNTETGVLTVSLADPTPGVSCRAIVQGLFGPEAGGKDGIAGGARGKVYNEADMEALVAAMVAALA